MGMKKADFEWRSSMKRTLLVAERIAALVLMLGIFRLVWSSTGLSWRDGMLYIVAPWFVQQMLASVAQFLTPVPPGGRRRWLGITWRIDTGPEHQAMLDRIPKHPLGIGQ